MFPKLRLPCHFVAKNFDKRVVGGGHRSKVSGSTTVGGEERLGSDKLQGPPDAFFQMEDQPSMSGPKWGVYI